RGWYYRYSHLHSIDPAIKLGGRVKMGQKLGLLGKEGSSGGWAHLHFDVSVPQPSGRYGVTDAYAFAWQAYRAKHPEARLKAVARPHRIAWVGDEVTLDGGRSWSAEGPKHIVRYDWTFSDGAKAEGPVAIRRYDRAGEYSEIFNVTDADGRVDYDFAVVVVNDRNQPKHVAPTIHAVYWPSERIAAGDEVTFMVRSFAFAPGEGVERWDFGDGGPAVETRSAALEVRPDGARPNHHAKDGYAVVKHRYVAPGDYLVSVSRTNNRGQTATARLHVYVE
ncbi:MAG: PKD domain-containing protein, partial [Pirellulaceae bacterium]|nr:PKD domain-containing protein [Pirellulaceae bacterium]